MREITKEDLLSEFGQDAVEDCEQWISDHFLVGIDYAVIVFKDAHSSLKNIFCFNGGDEDWIVLTKKQNIDLSDVPSWIVKMDGKLDPHAYILDNYIVFVGSHS